MYIWLLQCCPKSAARNSRLCASWFEKFWKRRAAASQFTGCTRNLGSPQQLRPCSICWGGAIMLNIFFRKALVGYGTGPCFYLFKSSHCGGLNFRPRIKKIFMGWKSCGYVTNQTCQPCVQKQMCCSRVLYQPTLQNQRTDGSESETSPTSQLDG